MFHRFLEGIPLKPSCDTFVCSVDSFQLYGSHQRLENNWTILLLDDVLKLELLEFLDEHYWLHTQTK